MKSIFTSHRAIGARPDTLEPPIESPPRSEFASPLPAPSTPLILTNEPVIDDPLPAPEQRARDAEARQLLDARADEELRLVRRQRQVEAFTALVDPVHQYARQVIGLLKPQGGPGNHLWRLEPFESWDGAYEQALRAGLFAEGDLEFLQGKGTAFRNDETIRLGSFFMDNLLLSLFEIVCSHLQRVTRIHVAQLLRNRQTRARLAQWTVETSTTNRIQYTRDRSITDTKISYYKQQRFALYFKNLLSVTDTVVLP